MPWLDDKSDLDFQLFLWSAGGGGGGGNPHMKGVGMLVVSLRGVNSGFWVFWAKRRHI